MKISNSFSINWHDTLLGFLTAIGTSITAVIGQSISMGIFIFDWTTIWHAAVAGAFGYLQVKFFYPVPKTIQIDPSKTSVIDKESGTIIIRSNNFKNK